MIPSLVNTLKSENHVVRSTPADILGTLAHHSESSSSLINKAFADFP
jgi:hypothetical protein